MKLKTTQRFPASPSAVYERITDPAVLQQCIQGCEKMVKTAEDAYDVHMKLGLAGLKGNYTGKVKLDNLHPPDSYTLMIEGKGGPGFVKGTAHIRLAAVGAETELHCEADAQVGGLIASIGSRLIEAAAKKMMESFFRKFEQQLAG